MSNKLSDIEARDGLMWAANGGSAVPAGCCAFSIGRKEQAMKWILDNEPVAVWLMWLAVMVAISVIAAIEGGGELCPPQN